MVRVRVPPREYRDFVDAARRLDHTAVLAQGEAVLALVSADPNGTELVATALLLVGRSLASIERWPQACAWLEQGLTRLPSGGRLRELGHEVKVSNSRAPETLTALAEEPTKATSVAKKPRPKVVMTEEGRKVHAATFVFDGHNDLPWELRTKADSSFDKRDIAKNQPEMHTDIPRLRKGGVGAQFWSVYVPSETMRSPSFLGLAPASSRKRRRSAFPLTSG